MSAELVPAFFSRRGGLADSGSPSSRLRVLRDAGAKSTALSLTMFGFGSANVRSDGVQKQLANFVAFTFQYCHGTSSKDGEPIYTSLRVPSIQAYLEAISSSESNRLTKKLLPAR